jgi:hypothetical protein
VELIASTKEEEDFFKTGIRGHNIDQTCAREKAPK